MSRISQVSSDHRFPSGFCWPIANLRTQVGDIAQRFGLTVEAWEEDGLGPASGMFIRLPSARVMLWRELEFAIEREAGEGLEVHADAGDLSTFGVEVLVAEALEALDLPPDAAAWVASDNAQRSAADLLARSGAVTKDGSQGS